MAAPAPGSSTDQKATEDNETNSQPNNDSLQNEVEKLKQSNAMQQSQIESLIKANEQLQKLNAQLIEEKQDNSVPEHAHLKAEPSSASIIGISDTVLNELDESESKEATQLLSMESRLNRARLSLQYHLNPVGLNETDIGGDIVKKIQSIPKWVLDGAQGIAFLSVIKVGFVIAANIGAGFIIIKREDGKWSSPAAIGVAGVSAGFLAGASKVDYIMILQDDIAIKQFTSQGHIRLGAEVQLTVGPVWYFLCCVYIASYLSVYMMGYWFVHNVYFQVGVDGSASATYDDKGVSVIYSYSHSKGLYGGLGLDGKIVLEQQGVNEAFYDKKGVTSKQILDGEVDEGMPKNEDYEMILDVLEKVMDDDIMLEQVAPDNLNAHQTIVDKSKE